MFCDNVDVHLYCKSIIDNMDFPYEFIELTPEETEDRKMFYFNQTYVKVGPKKYFLPAIYKNIARDIYNLKLKPDDVFVLGYCRSGTTWTQEMVWLLQNNLDFENANTVSNSERVVILESSMYFTTEKLKAIEDRRTKKTKDFYKQIEILCRSLSVMFDESPSPRTIKSHLPLSFLPPNLLKVTKVVYICRDPRDVMVSLYKLLEKLPWNPYLQEITFNEFFKYFTTGLCSYGPYFENVKEAWAQRHHPNMMFLFYEDLVKDLPSMLRRIAKFLNKELTEDDVGKLCDHLKINNIKKNDKVNEDFINEFLGLSEDGVKNFVRKGEVGGWRAHFDEATTVEVEKWIMKNLEGTDLRFPSFEM